jgi:hypothetical protein
MKFREKLHIAVQKGYVITTKDGGVCISRKADMRDLFPNMRSATWRSVYRSMIREGYVYRARQSAFYL